jgi:RNA polymerase sigma-B factor
MVIEKELEQAREKHLWRRYREHPSEGLREQLVERYRWLARSALRRLPYGEDEDLRQVALLALIKAVDRFDHEMGRCFSTFAFPTILGELKRYLRDHSYPVRPSRTLHELRAAVCQKDEELTAWTGRPPTLAEVAEALGTDLEQVVEALAIEEVCRPRSLNASATTLDEQPRMLLEECVGVADPGLREVEVRLEWQQNLDGLGFPFREILELRYYQGLTQREVGQRLGFSQMHVSRLERRALARLREQLTCCPG